MRISSSSVCILHFCIAVLAGLLDPIAAHWQCGTKSQSKEELDVIQSKIDDFKRTRSSITCKGCITIDTYVYVFRKSNGQGSDINKARIDKQMQILNTAFAKTPFKFQLIEANFEVDDYYVSNFFTEFEVENDDYPVSLVAKWPRRGDYTALNFYFGGNKSDTSFAILPVASDPSYVRGFFPLDAVYLSTYHAFYDESALGLVPVHEVGHWLGLLHVFDSLTGKACDPTDLNDFVADTPQMANITYGTDHKCPSDETDTCPLLPGKDPIHNHMDYSSDSCRNQFTQGQIDRMYYMWSIYRKGRETCSTGNKLFEFEILTDSFPRETYWSLKSTDGKFSWNTRDDYIEEFIRYPANTLTTQEICIDATKNYTFAIYDDGNDGIFAPGYYAIRYNGTQLKRKSAFGKSETTRFAGGLKPSPTLCFSGNSRVHLLNKGWVRVADVKIGDKVLVSAGNYEEIYSFGHRNIAESAQFLQIYSNDTDVPIEISSDHLLLLSSEHWVPAETVRVGDLLTKGDGNSVVITRLQYVTRTGVFAPFTQSGSIVVNDIVASNYVTFQEGSEYLIIGGVETPFSYHWLAHTFESGHRLVCNMIGCEQETYTDSGISHWVYLPHIGAKMLLNRNPMITALIVFPLILVFAMVSFVEHWSTSCAAAIASIVVVVAIMGFGHVSFRSATTGTFKRINLESSLAKAAR